MADLRDDALGRIGAGNATNIAVSKLEQAYKDAAANVTPSDTAFNDYLSAKNDTYGKYSYLTGGPNMGLINQLNQQKKDKAKLYKTNRADVENMYGQLTSDVEVDNAALQQSYDTGIQQAGQRTQDAVAGLSAELAAQNARRTQGAKELGIQNEVALGDPQSTGALNEAMGTLLGQNQNWQGLLTSQKQSAMQQGQNVEAGIGNTRNQITTGMKQTLDFANANINNAIRSEKSRVAVRKLTDEGKLLMGVQTDKLKKILETEAGLTKPEVNKFIENRKQVDQYINSTLYSDTYKSPATFKGVAPGESTARYSAGSEGYHAMMTDLYQKAVRDAQGTQGTPMPQLLLRYGQLTGLTPGMVTGDYTNQVPSYGNTGPGTMAIPTS